MKIVTIIGARPQFIKAAVLSRIIKRNGGIKEVIVHTGQHFDTNMSEIFFEQMEIPTPDYNLNINGLGHGAMTGQMLEKIEEVLIKENPDMVVVYGDTNSTLAGALAAKKLHLKVIHIEAGLRSFNKNMPEEINRILTDRISDILFCPTNLAIQNLKYEGYANFNCKIIHCGDVMMDAALFYKERARQPILDGMKTISKKFVLCTVHRAENTDDLLRLKSIFDTLDEISINCDIIFPLHPRTKAKLLEINYDIAKSKICFLSPVGYLEMVWLLKNCQLVITDSGGLQKEAYLFQKYCMTLREETEWMELVDNEFNFLVGADKAAIMDCFVKIFEKKEFHSNNELYGYGNAGEIIYRNIIAART